MRGTSSAPRGLSLSLGALLLACGGSPAAQPPPIAAPPATTAPRPAEPGLAAQVTDGARSAWQTLHREPAQTLVAPPSDAAIRPYAACPDAEYPFDLTQENSAALAEARSLTGRERFAFDVLVVPGYVPLDAAEPVALTSVAQERLDRALADFTQGTAPFIVLSGGNVHPEKTPFNEALEMKRYLVTRGVPERRLLVEPCARHSHTNLRNAGRLMLHLRLYRGLVVTSYDQAYYFGMPLRSSFDGRCLADLGYLVGTLQKVDDYRVAFTPNGRVFEPGPDARDP